MFEQTIYLVAALATIGAFLFEVWRYLTIGSKTAASRWQGRKQRRAVAGTTTPQPIRAARVT